jgi:hypothetical protein
MTYSKVTRLATVVAAAAGASAAQAEGRAVSLDVTKTLAVVALLGLGGSGKRASVGLVAFCKLDQVCRDISVARTGLLAVVAETLSRRADLSVMANIATLVASTSREGRHFENRSESPKLVTLFNAMFSYALRCCCCCCISVVAWSPVWIFCRNSRVDPNGMFHRVFGPARNDRICLVVELEHVLARRPGPKVDGDMGVIPSHHELRRRAYVVEVAADLDDSAPMLKVRTM